MEVGHDIIGNCLHDHLAIDLTNHHRLISLAIRFSLLQESLKSFHLLVHLFLLLRSLLLLSLAYQS